MTTESTRDPWTDDILPMGKYGYGGKWAVGPPNDRRRVAIRNVLNKLPLEHYQQLVALKDKWAWFVPMKELWGKAAELPQGKTIVFITPMLEFASIEAIESIVVHELLHIIFGHKLTDCTKEENELQELQVAAELKRLGYEEHLEELRRVYEMFPTN